MTDPLTTVSKARLTQRIGEISAWMRAIDAGVGM